ncbi:MAG: FHA domain-containing protein [Spirochaetales bacterium]|nr:FHA domain-containing protein [Spirochaetales bacterium]
MVLFGKKYCKKGHKMDPSWKICPVCITPLTGWLVHFEEGKVSQIYDVHLGKNLVGKGEECEVRILLDSIQRHHALIMSKDGEYKLIAQSSESLVMVNGNDISSINLIDGDMITLGKSEFKFKSI